MTNLTEDIQIMILKVYNSDDSAWMFLRSVHSSLLFQACSFCLSK